MFINNYKIRDVEHTWFTENHVGPIEFDNHHKEMYNVLYEMLKWWIRIAKKHDIRWFAMDGTLLGAVRNKGFIPWDDDVDMGAEFSQYKKILALTHKKSEKFSIEESDCGFRIHPKGGSRTPFCDILMFGPDPKNKNSLIPCSLIVDGVPTYYASLIFIRARFDKPDIRALEYTNFEDLIVPVPQNAKKYLFKLYSDKCLTTYVRDMRIRAHNILDYVDTMKIAINGHNLFGSLGLNSTRDIKGHASCLSSLLLALWLVEFDETDVKWTRTKQAISDYVKINVKELLE